jgi:hypothetical protein
MFATEIDSECGDCLRILRRDGVAEGHALKCFNCSKVRIERGKRIYVDNTPQSNKAQGNSVVKTNDKELE